MWPETQEKVELEIAQLERLVETHRSLLRKVAHVPPDNIETSALSAYLHAFYTGLENIFKQMQRHKSLGEYLSKELGIPVRFTILSRYPHIITRFVNRDLDGAFFGAFTSVLALQTLFVEPIARPVNIDGSMTTKGYLFTHADSGISNVKQMRGKSIAYVDQHGLGSSDDTIDYAYSDGSTWHIEKIADKPRVLAGTDQVLPGSNTAAQVAYSDASPFWYRPPVHATRGSWTLDTGLDETADEESAAYMAMALDSSGNPAIAYLDTETGDVRFAIYDGSSWSVETVLSGDVADSFDDYRYLDMAFDSWGYAHLVYYDSEAGQLSYSYRSGSSWYTTHTWELDAFWVALDIDSNNAPHFAYYDNSDGNAYIIDGQPIPEPATMVLFGLGLLGLGARLRRRTTSS